jgi:hypothetical protein
MLHSKGRDACTFPVGKGNPPSIGAMDLCAQKSSGERRLCRYDETKEWRKHPVHQRNQALMEMKLGHAAETADWSTGAVSEALLVLLLLSVRLLAVAATVGTVDGAGTRLRGLSVESTMVIVVNGSALGAPDVTESGTADKFINGCSDVNDMGVAVGDDTGNAVGGSVGSGGIVSVALTTVGDSVNGDTVGCAVDGGIVVGAEVVATGAAEERGVIMGATVRGDKFHFGPMYLQPSRPYSVRPGQSVSSPALLAGPLPH